MEEDYEECVDETIKSEVNSLTGSLSPPRRTWDEETTEYPEGIASSFPFNDMMKLFLNNCDDIHQKHDSYLYLIREVYHRSELAIGREPTRRELEMIAASLCVEYPCLRYNKTHVQLLRSLYGRKLSVWRGRQIAATEKVTSRDEDYRPIIIKKPATYPRHFPYPFPLAPSITGLIKSGKVVPHANNKSYCRIVQEIGYTLVSLANNARLTNTLIDTVARVVCAQYPVLRKTINHRPPHHVFFLRLKRITLYLERQMQNRFSQI